MTIAVEGQQGVVAYIPAKNGKFLAGEFMAGLFSKKETEKSAAAIWRLFQHLAKLGTVRNEQKFKKVEGEIWEFKDYQARVFGFFGRNAAGKRCFFLTHGFIKKKQKLPRTEIDRANSIMNSWLRS
jgi:phage-related protein